MKTHSKNAIELAFRAGFYAGVAVPRVDDQEMQAQGEQAWTRYVMSMSSTQKMAMMRPDLYPGPQATDICAGCGHFRSLHNVLIVGVPNPSCAYPYFHRRQSDNNLTHCNCKQFNDGRGVPTEQYTEGAPRLDEASQLLEGDVPTPWAYEQACKALEKTKKELAEAREGFTVMKAERDAFANTMVRSLVCGKCGQPIQAGEPTVGRHCESQQYHLLDCTARTVENVLPPGGLFAVTHLNTAVVGLVNQNPNVTMSDYAEARERLIAVCLASRSAATTADTLLPAPPEKSK